jgi:hypothetical protein
MGPRDHPGPLPDGALCTACGAPVPTGRIRILARRDDLAFVQLDCVACGSGALGLLMDPATADGQQVLDVAGDPVPVGGGSRSATVRPISQSDVDAIRDDLAAWDGDLVGWLDALEDSGRSGAVNDR